MIDMQTPGRKNMHRLIDQIGARGFNYVLMNVYAHDTVWAKGRTSEWDYGPPPLFVFGGANEKPDHTRLNTDYFKAFDEAIHALHSRGIVANLMIKVYNKMVHWPAPGSKDEERYFRYVTARYQGFTNVTWSFSKEAYNEPDKVLQGRLVDLIRTTDGYDRLATIHDDDLGDWTPAVRSHLDFRTDQEHFWWKETLSFDRSLRPWPVINAEVSYERGVGPELATYGVKHSWDEVLRRAYEVYLSGGYFAYYYAYTAWDVVRPDPEPPGLARLQLMKESLSALPYWRMEPSPKLAVGGPCLAVPGEVYAIYVNSNELVEQLDSPIRERLLKAGAIREITVNLTALTGPAKLQWLNTWTGERVYGQVDGPGVYQYLRPARFGEAPALLIVRN